VDAISYKPLVGISPNLHLRCSLPVRVKDELIRVEVKRLKVKVTTKPNMVKSVVKMHLSVEDILVDGFLSKNSVSLLLFSEQRRYDVAKLNNYILQLFITVLIVHRVDSIKRFFSFCL